MRRLIPQRHARHRAARAENRDERGAASVIVAVLLVVLMGFGALAVDVGAMYAEKAQLQNGADASALAIANDCGNGSCGSYNATGSALANSNSNDNSSGIASITFPTSTSVRVETNTRQAGSGVNSFSLFFARVMGFDTTDIRAVAVAKWGAPTGATTLPWTISQCVFEKYLTPSQLAELHSTGNFTGNPIPTHILLRYDENTPDYPGCPPQNGYAEGGFGWLDRDTGCTADIDIANSEIGNDPGNDFPSECNGILAKLLIDPVLIPVFSTATGNGQHATYGLVGFLAFKVTGYKFGGGPSLTNLDSAAPSCTGNCRGIQGYFTRYVSLAEGLTLGGSGTPNFGGSGVALTQ